MTKLEPHHERLIEERDELEKKTTALQKFVETSNTMMELSGREANDLNQQLSLMQAYLAVLERRINRIYF